MPLILAIESDRRQASQLTAIVRNRLHAELVIGESAERALAALGQRVPDLILTSALLSPRDESALGERLRALDGAAAHVQTLTIPVLASASGRGGSRASGVLSALRRDKGKPVATAEGCDPAVFAEQCKEYLERAATEREAFAEQAMARQSAAAAKAKAEPAKSESVVKPKHEPSAPKPTQQEWTVQSKDSETTEADSFVVPAPEFAPATEYNQQAPTYTPPSEYERPAPTYTPPVSDYNRPAPVYTPPPATFARSGYDATSVIPDYAHPNAEWETEANEPVAAAAQPEPIVLPEPPLVTPKAESTRKRSRKLTDDVDGPASLLAAVAALEAEEQVRTEPVVAPRVESHVDLVKPPTASTAPVVQKSVAATPEPDVDVDEFDLSSLLDNVSSGKRAHAPVEENDAAIEVYEIDTTREWAALDSILAETAAATSAASMAPPPAPAPVTLQPEQEAAPQPAAAKPWSDILEALKRDAEQLPPLPDPSIVINNDHETSQDNGQDNSQDANHDEQADVAAAADSSRADAAGKKKKKKTTKNGSPAQDEWGFFDPDQCGFAALIEKLEEITDKDEKPTPRRTATDR
ncbi:MAG TPA: hypothetical protein VH583_11525 [Vicinamibacterales bacterium]|jgi:hypothetical protein